MLVIMCHASLSHKPLRIGIMLCGRFVVLSTVGLWSILHPRISVTRIVTSSVCTYRQRVIQLCISLAWKETIPCRSHGVLQTGGGMLNQQDVSDSTLAHRSQKPAEAVCTHANVPSRLNLVRHGGENLYLQIHPLHSKSLRK